MKRCFEFPSSHSGSHCDALENFGWDKNEHKKRYDSEHDNESFVALNLCRAN